MIFTDFVFGIGSHYVLASNVRIVWALAYNRHLRSNNRKPSIIHIMRFSFENWIITILKIINLRWHVQDFLFQLVQSLWLIWLIKNFRNLINHKDFHAHLLFIHHITFQLVLSFTLWNDFQNQIEYDMSFQDHVCGFYNWQNNNRTWLFF